MDKTNLLTSKDMARFVADGLLRFDELVPEDLNQETCKEMAAGIPGAKGGALLQDLWQSESIGKVLRLPAIQGIIRSLVVPNPLYDHHAVHTVDAQHDHGQIWHADAIIDTRMHFDIQLFFQQISQIYLK